MSRHDHKATSRSPPQKGKSRIYSSQPPKVVGPEREGLIPVNKYDQRIDSPIPRLGGPTIERYNNIVPRPCNNKHLFGGCNDSACPYDHSVFDDEIIGIMRVQMRMYPCKERSICRRLGCLNSHMCQRCPGGQKAKTCRLPHAMHGIKTTVANMARAADCDVEEGEASIKMPMQSSFAEVEEKDDTVERGRSGGRSSLDASEPFGGVAIEGNGSEKMLLLEFSDDE